MIIVRGEAYGRTYDYECDLISRTDERAVFETKSEPKHRIEITPRYIGSRIGKPITVCAFFFNGKYTALALFREDNENNIEILPHEY